MEMNTLRPGLLVSLATSVTGRNVRYTKKEIGTETRESGESIAKWETERSIIDPVEHEAAGKVRSKARWLIRQVCADSAFGLLCPEANADELEKAIAAARKLAADFNDTAKLSRIVIYALVGKIAADDVEAVRAISSELNSMMEAMARGVANCDVRMIREAASKAKEMGEMLTPSAQAKVQIAVEAARSAAKRIVAAGEQAAREVDQATIRKITDMRTAFLDIDEQGEVAAPAAAGVALDLAPTTAVAAPKAPSSALELE